MALVSDAAPKRTYSRDEVCRLLDVGERVLTDWETHGFVQRLDLYQFQDLVALKALRLLRSRRLRPERIRLILESLREKLAHVRDPLSELKIFTDGRRLAVQVDGRKMEPLTGQLLLDFDQAEIRRLLQFPGNRAEQTMADALAARQREAEKWFERAIEMEQTGGPPEHIVAAYQKAIECNPDAPGPHANLGTVYFHMKKWAEAEREYRAAIELQPEYALAHFNLGNLHDELNQWAPALACYKKALEIQPDYADAHYNIALLYQGRGDLLQAVRHWRTYLKIDPAGYWAGIARRELSRLRQETIVGGAQA
ncbi:tetratricopeptide repeat protein [uncultured Paludibaculum sp.]|uniref:tetratricopeptide repeat protein n=1 Tax=uncultured Paludibaculum sp. TaxID=1765020 RepID=UPI002AAA79BF|nr:tetratricopeptide repeat protein [uncultured Paludibaculum sp.]